LYAIEDLLWDDDNLDRIARYNLRPMDVEQVTTSPIEAHLNGGKLIIFGEAIRGELITVVLESLGEGVWYTLAARPSTQGERLKVSVGVRARKGGAV